MTAGPHDAGGPADDEPPDTSTDALSHLDALRRAVYAPEASAADLAAYLQAVEARRIARSSPPGGHDSATDVAPVPPGRRAATPRRPAARRRRVALLAGAGILVAVAVVGIAAELLQPAPPAAPPAVTPVALPGGPSTTPTSSLDPTDRSARFREGSGGAAALRVPTVAGLLLVVRSDSGATPPDGTVDGFGERLEFAITCEGAGTVTLRLQGEATRPVACRPDRPTQVSTTAAPVQSVRYSLSVRGRARWVLAVGRTPQSSSSSAGPTG
ncbi:hypothetical protein [uncultured Amnibacterium sp.]|uniref:hypothetical protein n=1 Tax=uncultured Amnibacterium sp. TaxID=1631851 RepID=UPI0035C9E8C0